LSYEPTKHGRSCLGLIAAAASGTAVFIIGMWLLDGPPWHVWVGGLVVGLWLSAVFIAGPVTVLIGVPLYLFLRGRVRATPLNCGLTGAILGTIPLIFWAVVIDGASVGDLLPALVGAPCGALGGLVFWLVAAREINRDFELES
jgi:hypothetical protein